MILNFYPKKHRIYNRGIQYKVFMYNSFNELIDNYMLYSQFTLSSFTEMKPKEIIQDFIFLIFLNEFTQDCCLTVFDPYCRINLKEFRSYIGTYKNNIFNGQEIFSIDIYQINKNININENMKELIDSSQTKCKSLSLLYKL